METTKTETATTAATFAALQPFEDGKTLCEVNGFVDKILLVWASPRDGRTMIRTWRFNSAALCVDRVSLAPGFVPKVNGHERAQ